MLKKNQTYYKETDMIPNGDKQSKISYCTFIFNFLIKNVFSRQTELQINAK